MDDSFSISLAQAWETYQAYWGEYAGPVSVDEISQPPAEDDAQQLKATIKVFESTEKWRDKPVSELDPEGAKQWKILKKFLAVVIHPQDLLWLENHEKFTGKIAYTLAGWQYGLMGARNATFLADTDTTTYLATPVVPEPFYGDPRQADGIVIFNNPGASEHYNAFVDSELRAVQMEARDLQRVILRGLLRWKSLNATDSTRIRQAQERIHELASQLARRGLIHEDPEFFDEADWLAADEALAAEGGSWYVKHYLVKDESNRLFPRAPHGVFQAELCPYSSRNGSAFMDVMLSKNSDGELLPSLKKLLELVCAWLAEASLASRRRILFIRKNNQAHRLGIRQELEMLAEASGQATCVRSELKRILARPGSQQSAYVTRNNAVSDYSNVKKWLLADGAC